MPSSPPCLILIDWQKGFRDLSFWGARNNPSAEKNAASLLRHWRERGWPIMHAFHDSTEAASPLKPGGEGNEVQAFAEPLPGEAVYRKQVNSAFIGTELEKDLRALELHQLVITGATTDHCVSTSSRMAGNLGFRVTLAEDACFTFDRHDPSGKFWPAQDIHDVHLASLHGEFAAVVTTDEVLAKAEWV